MISTEPVDSFAEAIWNRKGSIIKKGCGTMQAYARTDVGRLRNTNQDYIFSSTRPVGPFNNLFIVADGMGGHQAGDFASRSVVEELVSFVSRAKKGNSVVAVLEEGIKYAGNIAYEASVRDRSLEGMGTTLVAAVIEDRTLYVANVGDSRLYLIRQDISQVTRDHSYVEELVMLGQMERGSEDYQSKKHIITRAVGIDKSVNIDFFEVPLNAGDYILLCSDGLSNMLEEDEIRDVILSSGMLKVKAEQLITMANDNGGKDNIAVVLVEPQISEVGLC